MERPGAVKGAPLCGAAKRTLDGEDRSLRIERGKTSGKVTGEYSDPTTQNIETRYIIRPETGRRGEITDRDLDIFDAVLRYRFCSAAQLVRLAGGNENVTHRRLRRLWERGLVARWAFPGLRTHSEFYYYLDTREPLDLLAERFGARQE